MKFFEIVTEPINTKKYKEAVIHPSAGAVIVFTGHVREWTNNIRTIHLEYEAYIPLAEKMLAKIGKEVMEKWPNIRIAIAHRIGKLDITEIAVVVAVSSPHRKNAYEANEYAIRRLKEIVPIWKKEIWENGEEWIGSQRKLPKKEEFS